MDFEFDAKDAIFARIDRRRKIPVTIMLHALDFSNEEILDTFFEKDKYTLSKNDIKLKINPDHLKGTVLDFDIKVGRKLIIGKGNMINAGHLKQLKNHKGKSAQLAVTAEQLQDKIISHDVIDQETGELLASANEILTIEKIELLIKSGIKAIETIYINDLDHGSYISNSLRIDPSSSKLEALICLLYTS